MKNAESRELPLIIGHRGACGYLPEHTRESFQRAVDLGADAIETDVVMTRDRHLICRHDCELSLSTDVAAHPEFASRRTRKTIDHEPAEGWFVEDFTLDDIRTLRARERFNFRDPSFDGKLAILTLDDLLEFFSAARLKTSRPLRVIIEIKHAAYFDSIAMPMDEAVAAALSRFSLTAPDAPACVECFEIDILHRLRRLVQTPLIQLLDRPGFRPADDAAAGGSLTYADMITPIGLARIATYASAIGAWKGLIVPTLDPSPGSPFRRLDVPTQLITNAHAAGLAVHAWTFRNEPRFLAADYGANPATEYQQFARLGLDGFITDFPDTARSALRTT